MAITVRDNFPSGDSYSNYDPITVGASPFVWTNNNACGVRVFMRGGLITGVEYQSWHWPEVPGNPLWMPVGVPWFIDLNPLDSVRVT